MKTRKLGKTGIDISALSFGTAGFAGFYGAVDEASLHDAVKAALENGINYFDTSPYYGSGKSEEILGRALKAADLPRHTFHVQTKLGRYGLNEFDFSAARVRSSVEESLRRLQLSYLDVVLCHDIEFEPDLNRIVQETIPALRELKRQGLVKHFGICGYPLEIFRPILEQCEDVEVVQSYCRYTLFNQDLEQHLPYFAERNAGVINASVLGMSLLTPAGPPEWHPAPVALKDACRAQVERGPVARTIQAAMQFSLRNERIASTLVGFSNRAEVESAFGVAQFPIQSDDEWIDSSLKHFSAVSPTKWASGNYA